MCMNAKHRNRKEAIDKLLGYLLARLNEQEGKGVYRDKLLNAYAYDSGVSIRTLREYTKILIDSDLIKSNRDYVWPLLSLVDRNGT